MMTSCAVSIGTVNFEVLEPAGITINDKGESPYFINRAPIDPAIINTSSDEFLDEEELRILDTIIINNVKKGINEILEQNNLGFGIVPEWKDMRRRDTIGKDVPLSTYETSEILYKTGSDILFSLEVYRITSNVKVYMDLEYYDYYAEVAIMPEFKWNIYLPAMPKPAFSYTFNDTLYWGNYGQTRYEALEGNKMPSPLEIIRETAQISGEKFAAHIMPHWILVERDIYQGNEEAFKQAAVLSNNGEWEKAAEIWNELLKNDKSTIRGKAAFNLAVWYEMNDELDKAHEYALLAESCIDSPRVKGYIEELKQRIKNKGILESQLN